MTTKKPKMGFETTATKLEDEYEQIRKLLEAKKIKWEKVEELTSLIVKICMKAGVEELKKSRPEELTVSETPTMLHWTGEMLWITLIMLGITRIGTELNELGERLAEVQRCVKELKLGRN